MGKTKTEEQKAEYALYQERKKEIVRLARKFGACVVPTKSGRKSDGSRTLKLIAIRCPKIGLECSPAPEPFIDMLKEELSGVDIEWRRLSDAVYDPDHNKLIANWLVSMLIQTKVINQKDIPDFDPTKYPEWTNVGGGPHGADPKCRERIQHLRNIAAWVRSGAVDPEMMWHIQVIIPTSKK